MRQTSPDAGCERATGGRSSCEGKEEKTYSRATRKRICMALLWGVYFFKLLEIYAKKTSLSLCGTKTVYAFQLMYLKDHMLITLKEENKQVGKFLGKWIGKLRHDNQTKPNKLNSVHPASGSQTTCPQTKDTESEWFMPLFSDQRILSLTLPGPGDRGQRPN